MNIDKELVYVITSATLGEGDPNLGAKLTESLFTVLSTSQQKPSCIIFINSGVFLTTKGSPVVESLKLLEEAGTVILSCTTCLNYFERMDKILVGRPGDMKDTVDATVSRQRVITF